jgi:DNA-binding MarR family transcriptional regulator
MIEFAAPQLVGLPSDDHASRTHPENTERATHTLDSLRRLVRALRAGSVESERRVGLSGPQLFALRQIAAEPNQSISDVAARTFTTQSSASELIGRFVEHGLVARHVSAADRRRVELSMTPLGRAALDHAERNGRERLLSAFGRMSADEQTAAALGLDAWMRAAGLPNAP